MEDKNAAIIERLSRIDALTKRYQGQRSRGGRRGGRRNMANPHRGQGRVLTLLRLQPEITQKDLGYLLDMRTQSLGELLSKLEKVGYITKEPSEIDRRSMVVKLTPEGAKAAENLVDSEDEWSVVFGNFTEEESDQLITLLNKLIGSLERATEAEGDGRGRNTPPYSVSPAPQPGFFVRRFDGGFESGFDSRMFGVKVEFGGDSEEEEDDTFGWRLGGYSDCNCDIDDEDAASHRENSTH